ncbi:MAG: hypothetical protein Q7S84_01235 [bacterium]|nr:hypothetical protein [bacterium]
MKSVSSKLKGCPPAAPDTLRESCGRASLPARSCCIAAGGREALRAGGDKYERAKAEFERRFR